MPPSRTPKLKEEAWGITLRVVLVSVNVFVLLLCLAVCLTGVWGRLEERTYSNVTGERSLTSTSVSVAVAGACAFLLSLVGILGSVLLKALWGRIMLSVYAFVLVLLIMTELAAGIAALRWRSDDLGSPLTNYTQASLRVAYEEDDNNTRDAWDAFQTKHKCCGATNYTEYFVIFNETKLPSACCTGRERKEQCPDEYVTHPDLIYINTEPCLDIMRPHLKLVMLRLAIVAIGVGSIQIMGAIASVIAIIGVVYREEKKTKSYTKLTARTAEYSST